MRRIAMLTGALCIGAVSAMAGGQAPAPAIAPADSASVAVGTVFATMMGQQLDAFRQKGIAIDNDAFLKAFSAQLKGENTGITPETADAYMMRRFEELEAAAPPSAYKQAQQQYVDSMATVEGFVATPSGLLFQVITEGEGPGPSDNDTAVLEYTGRLSDGTVFDGTNGQTVELPVGGLIAGFTEGLKMMKPGGKYRLIIPSELGYGKRGAGPIPGDSALDFEIVYQGVKQ